MYKKAIAYDSEVIFYFDAYGNKYVAKGGSLAWRTNNPGLIHSHSILHPQSIGACGQIAIFPSYIQGERALYDWLRLKKYYHSTLIVIAKHYEPNNPENFHQKLCQLTSLKADVKLSSLSPTELKRLVWGIKKLVGFLNIGNEEFLLLPKITARFYSKNAGIESYLVGTDQVINKSEAIHRVETHRLDAIIVHKKDKSVYLRSRPGHLLHKIHLNQKDIVGSFENFEDITRDCGAKKNNQCIWAFINGIWNSKDHAMESALKISTYAGGEFVWSLINDTKIWPIGDVVESLFFKVGLESKVVKMTVKFFKFLLKLSHDEPNHPPVIVIAHSQGAMISELALQHLTRKERQELRIFTFGGWTFIPAEMCHQDSHNYFSPYDLVAKGGSPRIGLFLLQLKEGEKRGLKTTDTIEELITDDQHKYLDTQHPSTIEEFRRQRREYYKELLNTVSNVTLLQESIDGPFEHSFSQGCYQKILEELIKKYQSWQTVSE